MLDFPPFKLPELDDLYPVLLQWNMDVLLIHLVDIFSDSLVLKYLPKAWTEAKVIFISKPGGMEYSNRKAYKQISLTSFFLKILKRLTEINRYIPIKMNQGDPPTQHSK